MPRPSSSDPAVAGLGPDRTRSDGALLSSYICAVPLLGFRDLLRDYREQAGRMEEFGRQLAMRKTGGPFVDMTAAAANPESSPRSGVR